MHAWPVVTNLVPIVSVSPIRQNVVLLVLHGSSDGKYRVAHAAMMSIALRTRKFVARSAVQLVQV